MYILLEWRFLLKLKWIMGYIYNILINFLKNFGEIILKKKILNKCFNF